MTLRLATIIPDGKETFERRSEGRIEKAGHPPPCPGNWEAQALQLSNLISASCLTFDEEWKTGLLLLGLEDN